MLHVVKIAVQKQNEPGASSHSKVVLHIPEVPHPNTVQTSVKKGSCTAELVRRAAPQHIQQLCSHATVAGNSTDWQVTARIQTHQFLRKSTGTVHPTVHPTHLSWLHTTTALHFSKPA